MVDVIIVGGRIAGSTLAARLGQSGLSVLLLERDELPSLPAASSPIIYAPALSLLDEIGADESAYAHNTPRIRRWIIEAENTFKVEQPIPPVHGRDYAYAIDRARFDAALWETAAASPCVDARQHTSVTDLLWDGDRVIGVKAKDTRTGETITARAPLTVGADGRFSLVARKVNAPSPAATTTTPPPTITPTGKTSPRRTTARPPRICSAPAATTACCSWTAPTAKLSSPPKAARTKCSSPPASPNNSTRTCSAAHPSVRARLKNARRVTDVHGMKKIGNLYRQAGGPGWALVGDALHQKDPLDGQGIYDALFTAKALADAIRAHHTNELDWTAATHRYEQAVLDETLPMYRATLSRVNREIYTRRPAWFMHTAARWLYEDEQYRQHWARLFVRQTDPDTWFNYRVALMPILRGLWRDITQRLPNLTTP